MFNILFFACTFFLINMNNIFSADPSDQKSPNLNSPMNQSGIQYDSTSPKHKTLIKARINFGRQHESAEYPVITKEQILEKIKILEDLNPNDAEKYRKNFINIQNNHQLLINFLNNIENRIKELKARQVLLNKKNEDEKADKKNQSSSNNDKNIKN